MKKCKVKITVDSLKSAFNILKEARLADITYDPDTEDIEMLFYNIGQESLEGARACTIDLSGIQEVKKNAITNSS